MPDDKVMNVQATQIPGMQIVFQQPLSPEQGHGISFQMAEDVTIDEQSLNELLDRVTGAARRLAFVEELPRLRHLLAAKKQSLESQVKERERAVSRATAFVTLKSAGRRQPVEPPAADQNSIAQFDARIAQLRIEIRMSELRVPYLEAVIAGDKDAVELVFDEKEAAD